MSDTPGRFAAGLDSSLGAAHVTKVVMGSSDDLTEKSAKSSWLQAMQALGLVCIWK